MDNILCKRDRAIAIGIDYQEKLMPAMSYSDEKIRQAVKLYAGLTILDVPCIFSQQYTKGLGETISDIRDSVRDFTFYEKTTFSAMRSNEFITFLKGSGKTDIILSGVETHICVLQTALHLIKEGYSVWLVEDCCASRKENDKQIALLQMSGAGVKITTMEAILFELMGGSKDPAFKAISDLIK